MWANEYQRSTIEKHHVLKDVPHVEGVGRDGLANAIPKACSCCGWGDNCVRALQNVCLCDTCKLNDWLAREDTEDEEQEHEEEEEDEETTKAVDHTY